MKGLRQHLLKSKEVIIDSVISPVYIHKIITVPRCIMELSMKDWTRMKHNYIHLSDCIVSKVNKNRIVTYNQVSYGDKVKPMKKISMINGKYIMWNEINLSRTVGKYLLITAKKSEYLEDKNIISIDATSRCDMNDREDGKYEASGIIVLCIYVLNKQQSNKEWAWGKKTS